MTGSPAPIRGVTRGPNFHWFGYYDKLQFDPTQRFLLAMEVNFEHRDPRGSDVIQIGMIDLQENDRWVELGTSHAWCWQQGCMLQWIPGTRDRVIWNDRQHGRYVCQMLNVATGERHTIEHPIYAVSPDGRSAMGVDFRRIHDTRPGYGYTGLLDPCRNTAAPDDSGIYHVDLETGECRTIVTIADIAEIPCDRIDYTDAKHYFNHILFSPDARRFAFLHRRRRKDDDGLGTRMFTAAPDGGDLHMVDDSGAMSHFIWRDARHILGWTRTAALGLGFHLFEDRVGPVGIVAADVMTRDGHCTYLPGGEWILNDTPPDADRMREVYVYNVARGEKTPLGRFHSPPEYEGPCRCDPHPRFSPDGNHVTIDSAHDGAGRQVYLIDIRDIV